VTKTKLLIVEEDESITMKLRSALEDEFEVLQAERNQTALDLIQEQEPLVVLLDLESPSNPQTEAGIGFLQELQQAGYPVKTVVFTGDTERHIAVQAVQRGAADVLSKPLDLNLLQGILRRIARVADLEREAHEGMAGGGHGEFSGMLGVSPSIRRIFDAIRKVSTTDVPILITGESGTGKELTAKAIHERGLRKQAPFIPINCGAIPENLLEAELFGSESDAGTKVAGQKQGRIEMAQGGTLFLDEVGELPYALQAKLLRFLQDRTFERVGGNQPIEMSVRLIAATNVNLKEAIEKGRFLEDLYFRLGVVHINLPPLRERGDDVSLIAVAFLRQAAAHFQKPIRAFTREALEAMRAYTWPGNVRELFNRVGRAVVMVEGTQVTPVDLDIPQQIPTQDEGSISFKVNQQRIETNLIMKAFTLSQGNLSRAAQELGISRSTLYRRLRQYGMDRSLDARRPIGVSQRAWISDH
jgi:Response regulator containing CheY-like receiver, AAA-type ATPase, and DNA-binding domains